MKIVGLFVATDSVHYGIKTVSYTESVLMKRHSLPFCERVNYLRLLAGIRQFKLYGPFNAVQVIVKPRFGIDEQGSGNSF